MLIYGYHSVIEYLTNNKKAVQTIFTTSDKMSKLSKDIIKSNRIEIVSKSFFKKKFPNKNHQYIAAEITLKNLIQLKHLIANAKQNYKNPYILMLDHITDVHNFGATIRNACFFNSAGIIIPKNRSVSINSSVVKTSAGTISHINLSVVTNLSQSIKILKDKGFWIYGCDINTKNNIKKCNINFPAVIILGNEQKGIHKKLKEKCDELIKIPGNNNIDSLNVSAAGAVVLYELFTSANK